MNNFTPRALKDQARTILSQTAPDYRKTVLFHEGITMAALLVVQLLSMLLNSFAGDTGGLDGIGTRSLLGTVISVLSTGTSILMPFWAMGIVFTSIRVSRREPVENGMLAEGFRRFGLVLRYYLLLVVVYIAIIMAGSYIVTILASFLPTPESMQISIDSLTPEQLNDPYALLASFPLEDLLALLIPILLITLVVIGALSVYVGLRLYALQYLVMDHDCPGVVAAAGVSNRITKGNLWKLLKLNLSFWWYYLLQFAASGIVYGGYLFTDLPVSQDVADLLFYLLYIGVTLAISWWAGAYVHVTHACAYNQLLNPTQAIESGE